MREGGGGVGEYKSFYHIPARNINFKLFFAVSTVIFTFLKTLFVISPDILTFQ